ncbi:MAG: hypothetical protein J6A59_17460 [Lachnospiraceae bacterium]|nr:hypothetical protein [Lachnospiraceae bacterium]
MINLVPSKQVREYLDEIGHTFTDSERATLIWHAAECSRIDRLMALNELAHTTRDTGLQEQIEERLMHEEKLLAKFKENDNGEFIYVVEDKDELQIGYFEKASTAIKFATGRRAECSILKQLIIKGNQLPPLSDYKDLYNKAIFGEVKDQDVGDYLWLPVAGLEIDDKGDVESLWCNEQMDYFTSESSQEHFENSFINIPFPEFFQRGIPVRLVTTGEYGIIVQGSEMWDDFIEKYGDEKDMCYFDMAITVVFLTDDGMWSHQHINPIYLEVEVPNIKEDIELARAIEALSDYWSGSGSEEIVLKYARQYADSKKKIGTAYSAKSVNDLIC